MAGFMVYGLGSASQKLGEVRHAETPSLSIFPSDSGLFTWKNRALLSTKLENNNLKLHKSALKGKIQSFTHPCVIPNMIFVLQKRYCAVYMNSYFLYNESG